MAKKGKEKSAGKAMRITPLGDRVLIQMQPREEKTASGIIIPDTVSDERSDSKRGSVVAVGEGKLEDGKRVPLSVKVGQQVLFQWGEKVEIDDEEFYLVSESNILGILGK